MLMKAIKNWTSMSKSELNWNKNQEVQVYFGSLRAIQLSSNELELHFVPVTLWKTETLLRYTEADLPTLTVLPWVSRFFLFLTVLRQGSESSRDFGKKFFMKWNKLSFWIKMEYLRGMLMPKSDKEKYCTYYFFAPSCDFCLCSKTCRLSAILKGE